MPYLNLSYWVHRIHSNLSTMFSSVYDRLRLYVLRLDLELASLRLRLRLRMTLQLRRVRLLAMLRLRNLLDALGCGSCPMPLASSCTCLKTYRKESAKKRSVKL